MPVSTRIVRALLVAGPIAFAAAPAPAEPPSPPARRAAPAAVLGEWWFAPVAAQGLVQVFSLHLAADRMTMTNHCRSGSRSVTARASAPARVGGGRIEALRAAEDERSWRPGVLICRAAVQAGTVHYEVVGDRLVLHDPKSDRTLEATRARP
jgi:hypothetical protein